MVYRGKTVCVGRIVDGVPFVGYSLEASTTKQRLAKRYRTRVGIELTDDAPEELKAQSERIQYDAIMFDNMLHFAVVTNGKQTRGIMRSHRTWLPGTHSEDLITPVLKWWGHEGNVGDAYNTSRIAVIIDNYEPAGEWDNGEWTNSQMGIVTEFGVGSTWFNSESIKKGQMKTLSTYTGEGNRESPKVPSIDIRKYIQTHEVRGVIAEELAEEIYGLFDPEYIVSSAVALWVPTRGKWELDTKNLRS